MTFRKIIKELRLERGFSQTEVANALKKTQSTISDWETGRSEPSNDDLIALSKYFDIKTDYLLGLEDEWGNPTSDFMEKCNGLPSNPNSHPAKIRSPLEEEKILEKYREAPLEIKKAIQKLLS